jgi:hypothetical protein
MSESAQGPAKAAQYFEFIRRRTQELQAAGMPRVEDKHRRLWMIVFGMLSQFIPVPRPLDT